MRSLLVGEDPDLALAQAVLAARHHATIVAKTPAAALEALVRGPAPDFLVVAAGDEASACASIRTVRTHVRGEGVPLLAIVPAAAVEAALDAGADQATPAPASPGVLAAHAAAAERGAGDRRGGPGEPGHELYFARNPHPMWFFDVDTLAFVAVNDAAVQKYGWTREEFLRLTIKDIRPPDDVERLLQVTSRVQRGLDRSFGWRHRAKDGRIFHVEIISYPVRYAGRACELVLAHDVSERVEAMRQLEELRAQLALSDRLASVGTLAAGVAHEINNPLTFVLANLHFAMERLPPALAAVRDALADAGDGARRVQAITRDLSAFSRGGDAELRPLELAAVVASAVALAENELRHRARTVVELAGAPRVLAHEGRLAQVFLNLLVNAAHAIPEGDAARNEVRIAGRREGDRAIVEVADTGSGIPPEVRERIFDPFFTTKRPGEGTGLGLWVCRRIVAGLGGSIDLVPGAGRGATFRLVLPAAPGAADAPRAAQDAPAPGDVAAPVAARRHVLVVDDEPLVGRALARALRDDADVEVETSSRAALERLVRGERFDLVLADVMMPDLAGADFHAALAEEDPALARAVVFMTGGAFTPRAQEFLARAPNACLEKPLDLARVRALLRR